MYPRGVRRALKDLLIATGTKWWLGVLAVLFVGAAGLLVGQQAWIPILFFVFGAALTVLDAWGRKEFRGRAKEAVASQKVLVDNYFSPLTRAFVHLSQQTIKPARMLALPDVLRLILGASLALTSREGSRASFFYRDGSRIQPHPTLSEGRGDPPTSVFDRNDDGEGAALWRKAYANTITFCPDTATSAPEGFDLRVKRSYLSFITVPVRYKDEPVGLLTINTGEANRLTEEDVGIMRVLGGLAETALTLCDGAWPNIVQ